MPIVPLPVMPLIIKTLGVLGGVLSLIACSAQVDLSQHKQQYSYAMGHQIGQSLKSESSLDAKAFAQGARDALEGKDSRISEEQTKQAFQKANEERAQKFQAESEGNLEKAKAFMEQNKSQPGVVSTDSGLQYKVVKGANKGQKPKLTDKVRVHYVGKLTSGEVFDSSVERGQPAEFPLKAVIKGWQEALQAMRVGEKWELWLPPSLGYGARAQRKIPANSVLHFEVELLGIVKD